MTTHHTLTIEPGEPGGMTLTGRIVFQDGTTATVYGDERVRVIAAAQRAIEQHLAHKKMAAEPPERLYLDDFGEIIRDEVAS